jgi:hypothetical protein
MFSNDGSRRFMLISHICRFIYLKTRKTAGTSVEIYFEPYCVDPRNYFGEEHARDEQVSEWGVAGSRRKAGDIWYNHMPAREVRDLVGPEKWNQYFKFCAIRNPYDKAVSFFWHDLAPDCREQQRRADFRVVRETFAEWTKLGHFPVDAPIYTLDGSPAVDDFIRYERLTEDMRRVCARLQIPWQPDRLGRYKSDLRKRGEQFEEYYTPEAAARVEQQFAWEFEYFQYPRLQGAAAT